jgi:hypothetical protein
MSTPQISAHMLMTAAAPAAALRLEALRLGDGDSTAASAPELSDAAASSSRQYAGSSSSLSPPAAADQAEKANAEVGNGGTGGGEGGVGGTVGQASPFRAAPNVSTNLDLVSNSGALALSSAGGGSVGKGANNSVASLKGGRAAHIKASGACKPRARITHALYEAPIYNTSTSAPVSSCCPMYKNIYESYT